MNLSDLAARIDRLHKLSQGFLLELSRRRTGHDPLDAKERKQYTDGLDQAIVGLYTSINALAKARERIREEEAQKRKSI